MLLLVNYRPEYRHQWGNKTYYTQLRLDPLGKESAEQLLDPLLGAPFDRLEMASPLSHEAGSDMSEHWRSNFQPVEPRSPAFLPASGLGCSGD